jgi:RsmE family RNA methyltransferase
MGNQDIEQLIENNAKSSKELKAIEEDLKALKEGEFELLRNNSEIKNEITILNKDISLREEKKETLNSSISSLEHNIVINSATHEGLNNDVERQKDKIRNLELEISEDKKKEEKKLERWQAIAEEAAKQSGRGIIPVIRPVMSWKEAMMKAKDLGHIDRE